MTKMYQISDSRLVELEAAKPVGLGGAEIIFGLIWSLIIGLVYQSFALGLQCFFVFIAADALCRYLLFKLHI